MEERRMERLKATWEVRAGIIPGQPMPEYTKQFHYLSKDREEDSQHAEEATYQPLFMKKMGEVMMYQMQLTDPRVLNWVTCEFIWY